MPVRRQPHSPPHQIGIGKPLRSCLTRIAVRCSIDCCGVGAMSPTPLLVGLWADSVGPEKAAVARAEAQAIVAGLDGTEPLTIRFLHYHEPAGRAGRERLRDCFAKLVTLLGTGDAGRE